MIIKQTDLFVVKPADKPFNSGHIVLSSHKHIFEMSDRELLEVAKALKDLVSKMKQAYKPEAYNVVFWDNKIEMWPRWCGDISFNAFYGLKTSPQTPQMIFESYR
ncbi:MAG: diadenosine tetraphosphate hydrolase [Thermoproteus sp.]